MAEAKARLETEGIETRGQTAFLEEEKAVGLFLKTKQLARSLLFEAGRVRDLVEKQRLSIAAAVILMPAVLACSGAEKENIYPTAADADNQEPVATRAVETSTPEATATVHPTIVPRPPEPTATAVVPRQEPTPMPPTPIPPTAEARRDLATFNFGEDVPENLRAEIRNGVNIGVEWILKKTGVDLHGVNVHAYGNLEKVAEEYFKRKGGDPRTFEQIRNFVSQNTAFSGDAKNFYVLTTSRGWTSSGPIIGGPIVEGRYHTIFHELYHSLQWQVNGYAQRPVGWLNEGGAHYIAARALDENTIGGKKIFPFDDIRGRHLRQALSSGNSLLAMEGDFNGDYPFAFMALDLLLRDKPDGGVGALTTYWREIGRGSGRDAAFLVAFGEPRPDFYNRFEAYRARGFQ